MHHPPTPIVSSQKTKPYKHQKNKKLALNSGIKTNEDETCMPSLSKVRSF